MCNVNTKNKITELNDDLHLYNKHKWNIYNRCRRCYLIKHFGNENFTCDMMCDICFCGTS